MPACGFKTYYVSRAKDAGPAASNNGKTAAPAIENEFYRITVRSDGRLEVFDKTRGVVLGSPQTGGLGDLAIYDMPRPCDTWLEIGPPGKRRDWQPAVAQCRVVQGPAFASLTIPGKIDGHAIAREVRLWRGSQRIEFGVDLNTTQRDDGILCIRFPIGLSGKVVAGIPFGVESRDNLEKEPFRGESFATGFPEGYDATRWTDVSSPQFGYTFICPPGMHTGYAFKKGDQSIEFILNCFRPLPKDVFARAATSIEGIGHHHWWCALAPHAGTWSDAKSYRQAMEQHVPLLAWTPAYGLGRGGAAATAEQNKPDRPQQDVQSQNGIRPQAVASLVEVTPGQRRFVGDAASPLGQARRATADRTASLRIDGPGGRRGDSTRSPRRLRGTDEFPWRSDAARKQSANRGQRNSLPHRALEDRYPASQRP